MCDCFVFVLVNSITYISITLTHHILMRDNEFRRLLEFGARALVYVKYLF